MWILSLIVVNYWVSSFGHEISKYFEIKSPFWHTEDMITVLKLTPIITSYSKKWGEKNFSNKSCVESEYCDCKEGLYYGVQICQWMAYNCTHTCPHTPVFIQVCYCRTCESFYEKLVACQYYNKWAQLSFYK